MGTMTLNKIENMPAPSITAASSISYGILDKKLLHIITAIGILNDEIVSTSDKGLLIRFSSLNIINIGTMTICDGSSIPKVTILLTLCDSFHFIRTSA